MTDVPVYIGRDYDEIVKERSNLDTQEKRIAYTIRMIAEDGRLIPFTHDWDPHRINFIVEDYIVIDQFIG